MVVNRKKPLRYNNENSFNNINKIYKYLKIQHTDRLHTNFIKVEYA